MRKICVISGSRAEYGLLFPVIQAIKKSRRLKLQLIVTGMHLSKKHGLSLSLVKKDSLIIDALVRPLYAGNTCYHMAESVARGVSGEARAFKKLKPDFVVVLGDRVEALSAAIAASYMNIPIAHIHGGDVGAGCIDNPVRDAITKLASLHFAASERSYRRIINLGEQIWRIFNVGSPAIDSIAREKYLDKVKLFTKFGFDPARPLLLIIQHPVTTEVGRATRQMEETMRAVYEYGHQTLVIYPNSDAGSHSMINVIKSYQKFAFIKSVPNISHRDYLSFLKYASVLIGNSSSGIIEAPSFKLAVVNIGIRQQGRQRSANIIDAPHNKNAIIKAIKKALYDAKFRGRLKRCKNPYGDGKASKRIADILSKVKINKVLQK